MARCDRGCFKQVRLARSAFIVFLALAAALPGYAAQSKPLLGPVEELSILDDFTTNSQALWKTAAGDNVSFKLESGRNIPGVANSLMLLELSKKNPEDRVPGHNWLSLKRDLGPGSIDPDADGIRLVMGSQPAAQWWINITLRVGSETYSHVLEPTYPSRTMIEHVIRFDEFTSSGHPLTRAQADSVTGIGLDLSVPTATLYLDRITTFRQQSYNSWLSFATSHPQHNIFQPGEPVLVTLTPGGSVPAAARGFRFEVQDFFEHVVTNGVLHLNGSKAYRLDLTPKAQGYYELRAYWVDELGRDLEKRSCILAEGSLPAGLATFALMPRTVAENVERFKTLRSTAFFGLHGDFFGLADLMGLTWRFEYSTWAALEPKKPDRSHGLASWAAERMQHEPARPDYLPHILPFSGNFGPPDWAKPNANKAAPFFDWPDYLPMVRDYVELEKHLYPHLKPRIYGVAWEVNLNMPPDNLGPAYTPADVVELHRRARQTIKAADPDALVIGPCASNLNPKWMESIFRAGLLQYVDGIECHGYADAGFMPEENDYPGKLGAIKEMMRRYNHGKVLPIYITEAGVRGMLGSKIVYRQQAQFITRLAIILKGEGVRVFLPFYGIDYDRDGWWGFCFNLEVDAKNPWGTHRISPKPAVNALATCAVVLEGAQPVRRVTAFGPDVWAYLFQRDETSILTVWSCGGQKEVSIPVRDLKPFRVVDIMGHNSEAPAKESKLCLAIDGSPRYILGVDPTTLQ